MAWAGNAHRTIYERKLVILRLYLSNFTSEHTAELGLGQGIRMLGRVGTNLSFVEIKAKFRSNLPRCWYIATPPCKIALVLLCYRAMNYK